MRHIIIDCDPGHDDAIAILLAIAHPQELNIIGITTVDGDSILENITDNALKLLNFVNQDIPVAKGMSGLDVTTKAEITVDEIAELKNKGKD
ncbi:nucleoside hydrolase [Neobacillus drentensis]|uniref:nucleoside hydrolase n=1 Tax=Neobacillus drentensis TaxID=220684 RepID=UPI002FFEB3BF